MVRTLTLLVPKVWGDVVDIKDRLEKSKFVQERVKLGAQLVFIQEQYFKQQPEEDKQGIKICEYLKSLKVEPVVKHTKDEDIIIYRHEPTTNMDAYIKKLLKADPTHMCFTFDDGFMRWLRKLAAEYKMTLAYLIMLLLNYGSALYHCSSTPAQFTPNAFKKIQEIKNHNIFFDAKIDKVLIQKIQVETYTNLDSCENLIINKNPTGNQPAGMSKNPTNTSQGKEKEFIAL